MSSLSRVISRLCSRPLSARDSLLVCLLTGLLLCGISFSKLCALSDFDHVALVAEGHADAQLPNEQSAGFWYHVPGDTPWSAVWVERTQAPDVTVHVALAYVRALSPLLLFQSGPIWDSYVDPDFEDPTFLWQGGLGMHPEIVAGMILGAGVLVLLAAFGPRVAFRLLWALFSRLRRKL